MMAQNQQLGANPPSFLPLMKEASSCGWVGPPQVGWLVSKHLPEASRSRELQDPPVAGWSLARGLAWF